MWIANRTAARAGVATVAAGVLAAGAFTLVSSAGASPSGTASTTGMHAAAARTSYGFRTLDDSADPTFNQLLGINDRGLIAGYFGSGAQGHPNMGYQLASGGSYSGENFPGSAQTQVTGLNNNGVTVGFWSGTNNGPGKDANFGWVNVDGTFRTADFPASSPASPATDQLLGVNDNDVAVGFYVDKEGNNHGYEYNITNHSYTRVLDPADPGASLTAAAINDRGDVAGFFAAGFYVDTRGNTHGFVATPATASVEHLRLAAMPQGTATFAWNAEGQLTVQLTASGLTPGSSHGVQLTAPDGTVITELGMLTANGAGQAQTTLTSTDRPPAGT